MWLCVCENIIKHFTACNIQIPECRRLALFSCVMTILTSWKGLCGYDRDDMYCQDFCTVCLLRTFPSHYSICKQHSCECKWFLLSSTYMLYFLVFLSFCDDFTNWEYCCESAIIYSMDRNPLQFPLTVHYLYMSCGASTKTICVFWRLWSMGIKLLEKHNFISLSYASIFIYKRCRTRESL